jgi:hypothetical protein
MGQEHIPPSPSVSSMASVDSTTPLPNPSAASPISTTAISLPSSSAIHCHKRVAVIGGGAAGLAAAKNLQDEHFEHFVVFERNSTVGGTWVHSPLYNSDIDPQNLNASAYGSVTSAIYDNLHTNLTPELMQYLDVEFPEGTERFMKHDVVLRYLERYAEWHGLNRYIRFNTTVEDVRWDDERSVWIVRSKTGSADADEKEMETREEVYDAVMVATGHYYKPFLPKFPGLESFAGRILHSRDYRNAQQGYANKSVLVIGGGSSGVDIAREVATVASKTMLSLRRPDSVGDLGESLDVLGLSSVGGSEDHDEPQIKNKVLIEKKPQIVNIGTGDVIEFEDGTSAQVDVILYCTGCKYLNIIWTLNATVYTYHVSSQSCKTSLTSPSYLNTIFTRTTMTLTTKTATPPPPPPCVLKIPASSRTEWESTISTNSFSTSPTPLYPLSVSPSKSTLSLTLTIKPVSFANK